MSGKGDLDREDDEDLEEDLPLLAGPFLSLLDLELLLLLLDRDRELLLLLDREELLEEEGDLFRSLGLHDRERESGLLALSPPVGLMASLLTGWYGPLSGGPLAPPLGGDLDLRYDKG